MDLPRLTYLSVDALTDSVGASQVLPYVEALSRRGMEVTLHSLEKEPPDIAIRHRLDEAGVAWRPHPWGGNGSTAGLLRLLKGASWLRGADLVHARSDIPAGSALLARCPAWVWDMRGFWADERIETGYLRPGSPQDRLMRRVERQSALRASGIVTLTTTAIDVLEERYGPFVRNKSRVITTCVELDHFAKSPFPTTDPMRMLLAGTLSARYDVPLMIRLLEHSRNRRPTELVALTPRPTRWDAILRDQGIRPYAVHRLQMPEQIANSHVGLSILRAHNGVTNKAAMPTKIGEFLASGRPVVVNHGLGDLDELLVKYDCGVVVSQDDVSTLDRSLDEIDRLMADPQTPERCRALAETHFNLEAGVTSLIDLYQHILR